MKQLSKKILILSVMALVAVSTIMLAPQQARAITVEELDSQVKGRDTSFYREFFENIVYEPFVSMLRLDEIWEAVSFKKHPAYDVNRYDEVPDSGFFVNRHGKNRMSPEALLNGPNGNGGPNPSGPWTVTKGKFEGVTAGLFVEDQAGQPYLLKFDPKDNPEMVTASEVIAHKIFYAIGYHVPEYHLVEFNPSILKPAPDATYYDDRGFKVQITQEVLGEILSRIPKMKGGLVRASASKILTGVKGYMDIDGLRKSDPNDLIFHEDRRSVRALRIFASWLNHYDMRKGNTLDITSSENGDAILKHYFLDFGSTFGSAAHHVKVPVAGFEHIVDWFEIGKSIPKFGLFPDDWEKRWDEAGRVVDNNNIGNFDNIYFHPGKWKTQLPYEAFDRLTASDAFWAAKIISTFSDADIKTLVSTGKYSRSENEDLLAGLLSERRDILVQYWFSKATPLTNIKLSSLGGNSYQISFTDLSGNSNGMYQYKLKPSGDSGEFSGNSFTFDVPELDNGILKVKISSSQGGAPLRVTLGPGADGQLAVTDICHGA